MNAETDMSGDIAAKDLDRLAELATIVAAAQDAINDDIVTRVSGAMTEGIALLDRLTRNQALIRLLHTLDQPQNQKLLNGLADALEHASKEYVNGKPAAGGLGGVLKLISDPGTQEGLKLLALMGKQLGKSVHQ